METMMELDELKSAWQTLDRRLAAQSALDLNVLKEGKLDKLRHGLRPLFWGQVAQILFGVVLSVFSGSFWTQHVDVPHLLITGVSMHVYAVMTIVFAAVTLVMINRVDYAAPVLAIQKQLAKLRRTYIFNGLCVGLPWWLLWMTLLQIAAMDVFGLDLYTTAPEWVLACYAFGLLGLFTTWPLHRWSRKRPKLAQTIDDNVTGTSLRNAQRFLQEIAEFERA